MDTIDVNQKLLEHVAELHIRADLAQGRTNHAAFVEFTKEWFPEENHTPLGDVDALRDEMRAAEAEANDYLVDISARTNTPTWVMWERVDELAHTMTLPVLHEGELVTMQWAEGGQMRVVGDHGRGLADGDTFMVGWHETAYRTDFRTLPE